MADVRKNICRFFQLNWKMSSLPRFTYFWDQRDAFNAILKVLKISPNGDNISNSIFNVLESRGVSRQAWFQSFSGRLIFYFVFIIFYCLFCFKNPFYYRKPFTQVNFIRRYIKCDFQPHFARIAAFGRSTIERFISSRNCAGIY